MVILLIIKFLKKDSKLTLTITNDEIVKYEIPISELNKVSLLKDETTVILNSNHIFNIY